jgi:hypothetical protein
MLIIYCPHCGGEGNLMYNSFLCADCYYILLGKIIAEKAATKAQEPLGGTQ